MKDISEWLNLGITDTFYHTQGDKCKNKGNIHANVSLVINHLGTLCHFL